MLKFKTSLPINDSNFDKAFEIRQFLPDKELYEQIVDCCREEFDNFSGSGSETINFFCAMHGECFCYVMVFYPCHLSSQNKPEYLFVPGGETKEQITFYNNIINNFDTVWEATVEHPAPCREYLLMGGIMHGYVHKETQEIYIFLELKNVPNPPDELAANG